MPRTTTRTVLGTALAAGLLAAGACGGDDGGATDTAATGTTGGDTTGTTAGEPVIDPGDGGRYAPEIDPADFVETVDNPYMTLTPGASWSYRGEEDGEVENVEVTVTDQRREVMGVSAVVVRDTVSDADGAVVEDTRDWFAQDREGNVWYMGEDTAEYEDGEVTSTEGSWEAGRDGALPGIAMPADPTVGYAYRQEYYPGEAEDLAEVARLGASESVPEGDHDDLLVIKEWNPLDPEVVEEKYYAAGLGLVLEVKVAGGDGRIELVDATDAAGPTTTGP
ncbi:MAG TPA: hypothetical protein VF743_03040 [Acidimicrobiales bacterium]